MNADLVRTPRAGMTGRKPVSIVCGAALIVVTAAHLIAQLTAPDEAVSAATQILLMPLLFGAVWFAGTGARQPLIRMVLIALSFSWLGDAIPRFVGGDAGFLVMVGCFMVAQMFYILALWPYRRSSAAARPLLTLPYIAAFAVLVISCAPGAGALLVPVVIYGLALMMMAMLATGLGALAGVGGAIFLLSDGLIALRSFTEFELPGHGFWIMLTYVVGQSMIAAAAVQRAGRETGIGSTEP